MLGEARRSPRGLKAVPLHDATLAFWGKARPCAAAAAPFHPVVAHSLDVAASAEQLDHQTGIGLPASTLAFLVALHDIGKFSRSFQAKAPEVWPAAVLGDRANVPIDRGHDTTGFALLAEGPIHELIAPLFEGWRWSHVLPLMRAVTGHHGRPPREGDRLPNENEIGPEACAAALDFVRSLLHLFAPEPLRREARGDQALAWRLAGLTTLADWIGSAQRHFPYVPAEALRDLRHYWETAAQPQARRAIAASGIAPAAAAPYTTALALLPDTITTLSPLQDAVATLPLPPGPMLAILEDATGAGKTEAALILAHRLMAAGRATGLFLALPTMATANAMYRRMAASYRRLFTEGARPSLALAHGHAALDPMFTASILADAVEDSAARATDEASESAGAQCAAWLAQDGRQALLAQVGVGTIDQALLSVLPVRHAPLRQRGLAGKVLVIDEAHAFDPYMREEMARLLTFHAALGGSAVLLSATLPLRLRQALTDAWRGGLGAPPLPVASQEYPLLTAVAREGVAEQPVAPRDTTVRRVAVARLDTPEAAVARIVAARAQGAAVAWVRNTVDDAIAACAALREAGVEPILFHARFAMADRLRIEAAVLDRFGRDGAAEQRPGVVVATQVIEQSLDLDFDLMVTDLAPVDLLIQRAGRLWRHERTRPLPQRELLILSPAPVEAPDAGWLAGHRGTAAVYRDPALLWRGLRALFAEGAIDAPGGLRALIEAAAEGEEPEGLRRAVAEALGKGLTQAATAKQNLLDVARGYAESAGLWASEERTPTRWEDRPQVTLRLARLRDGKVVPYAGDADAARAWALSEVTVAEHRIGTVDVPAALAAAAEQARSLWGRWERESPRIRLAVLEEEEAPGRWRPVAGEAYRYDAGLGLVWAAPAEAG